MTTVFQPRHLLRYGLVPETAAASASLASGGPLSVRGDRSRRSLQSRGVVEVGLRQTLRIFKREGIGWQLDVGFESILAERQSRLVIIVRSTDQDRTWPEGFVGIVQPLEIRIGNLCLEISLAIEELLPGEDRLGCPVEPEFSGDTSGSAIAGRKLDLGDDIEALQDP